MPTLSAGSNTTLTLTDYDSVTIACRGPVLVEAVSGLGVAGKIAEFAGTKTFGPFSPAGSLKLTAYGNDAQYEIADGVAPSSGGGVGGTTAVATATTLGLVKGAGIAADGMLSSAANTAIKTRLPTYAKARSDLAVGQSTIGVNVGIIGDSLSVGQFAISAANVGVGPYSLAALLAVSEGGTDSSFWGGIQTGDTSMANYLASDARITQGGGTSWTTWRLVSKVIAACVSCVTGTSAPLTFAPAAAWDTVDIYTIVNTTNGSLAVSGALTGAINNSGTLGINVTTLTKSQGLGSLTFVGTGENHIIGVNFYSKSVPKTNFIKMGLGSSTSTDWADSSANWKSIPALQKVMATSKMHLWMVQLGANDMIGASPVATFTTNMQTLITTLKRSAANPNGGDVVLVVTPPIPTGTVSEAIQLAYREAIYALAETNNLLVVDNYTDLVNYTYGASKGWYSAVNTVHQNASGYAEMANNIATSVVRAV